VAHEDNDKATNFCRVFTELAETYLIRIVGYAFENVKTFASTWPDVIKLKGSHFTKVKSE